MNILWLIIFVMFLMTVALVVFCESVIAGKDREIMRYADDVNRLRRELQRRDSEGLECVTSVKPEDDQKI